MLATAATVLISLVLGAWLIGSVLNQFQLGWFQRIASRDPFLLLPLWTFFAPNPGQSDYHLVYRDRLADGGLSEWHEIEISEPRRAYSCFWNPEKRSKKVLSDVVSTVVSSHRAQGQIGNEFLLSLQYLLLLNVVDQQPASANATHRQFLIVETFGFTPTEKPRAILRSDFHALQDERAA